MVAFSIKKYSLLSSLLLILCLFSLSPSTCQTQAYRVSDHPEVHQKLLDKQRKKKHSFNTNRWTPKTNDGIQSSDSDDDDSSDKNDSSDSNSTHHYAPHDDFIPSLKASIYQSKFTQFKDVYFDFILQAVTETNMSYLDFGHNMGFMRDNLFNVTSRGEDATFELVPQDNAFTVRATGIKVNLTSEYTRVRQFLITASGHVDVVC